MDKKDRKENKIGLVLAGGGGRGAYQIGVWKALREAGLDEYITSVAGSSVGGLNAALFVQNDLEKAEAIWNSISINKILTPKYESRHISFGLFERDGLEKIINEDLDMRCFGDGTRNCWISCVRVSGADSRGEEMQMIHCGGEKAALKYTRGRTEYFNLKYVKDDNEKKKILLATSAMPFVFPKVEINGKIYLDGGARMFDGDNVPVKPLYEIDKCNIILIVHLSNMDRPVARQDYPNATLLEIYPKENLGGLIDFDGILDFTKEGAKRRMEKGYNDSYLLFQRIKKIILSNQEELVFLVDAYEKEQRNFRYNKAMQEKNMILLKELYDMRETKKWK